MEKRLFDKLKEITQLLKVDIKQLPFDNLQTWQSVLDNFKVGQTVIINGTKNVCQFQKEKHIRFRTTMPVGTAFPLHWHPFVERCTILKGEMGEQVYGKRWRVGEVVEFGPFVQHIPYNCGNTDLEIIVDFLKL